MPKTMPKHSPKSQEIVPAGEVLVNGNNDAQDSFNEFISFFQSAAFRNAFQQLRSVHEDNVKLKEDRDRISIANLVQATSLGDQSKKVKALEQQLKEVEEQNASQLKSLQDENAALEKKLQERTEECDKLQIVQQEKEEKLSNLQNEVKVNEETIKSLEEHLEKESKKLTTAWEEYDIVKAERDEKLQIENEFNQLKAFSSVLIDYGTSKDKVNGFLDDLFKSAYGFCKKFLFPDLSDDSFNPNEWDSIGHRDLIEGTRIPLPASNSLVAKDMRMALGLSVISYALMTWIFRPIYLSDKEDDNVTEFLTDLGQTNSKQEAHVRSVLLQASPNGQVKHGMIHASSAAKLIFNTIKGLVPSELEDSCKKAIDDVCNNALETWYDVQTLREQVITSSKFRLNGQWRPLDSPVSLPHSEQSPKSENAVKGANQKGKGKAITNDPNSSSLTSEQTVGPSLDEQLTVVWPEFTITEDQSMSPGYYIPVQKFKSALLEQRTGERKRKEKRRNVRSASPQKRRSSFLGNGNGGGLTGTG